MKLNVTKPVNQPNMFDNRKTTEVFIISVFLYEDLNPRRNYFYIAFINHLYTVEISFTNLFYEEK